MRRTPHGSRPLLASRFPVHVTLEVDESLADLRDEHVSWHVEDCLRRGKGGEHFRLVHYSFQTHHLHLIVEALDARALTNGIRGLCVRLARRLNRIAGRRGRAFSDRCFARILRTPRASRAWTVTVSCGYLLGRHGDDVRHSHSCNRQASCWLLHALSKHAGHVEGLLTHDLQAPKKEAPGSQCEGSPDWAQAPTMASMTTVG